MYMLSKPHLKTLVKKLQAEREDFGHGKHPRYKVPVPCSKSITFGLKRGKHQPASYIAGQLGVSFTDLRRFIACNLKRDWYIGEVCPSERQDGQRPE